MFQPDLTMEKALRFSRFDVSHLLSTCSPHVLELEEEKWQSMEHYFQIHVAGSDAQVNQLQGLDALGAYNYAKPWYRYKRKGWKESRRVLMTRAAYTKVQMYPEVREFLLSTGDMLLVDTTQYDYYWGIGRDQRGENMLGKIWIDVRNKLYAENKENNQTDVSKQGSVE